jgi:hypothetical protein
MCAARTAVVGRVFGAVPHTRPHTLVANPAAPHPPQPSPYTHYATAIGPPGANALGRSGTNAADGVVGWDGHGAGNAVRGRLGLNRRECAALAAGPGGFAGVAGEFAVPVRS